MRRAVSECLRRAAARRVIAAVSGGPDSMALLHLLHASGAAVTAAHCNFHLRGEESDRDQRHVEEACAGLGIPLRLVHFDVEGYMAANKGMSVEMACRELRYSWFRSLLIETGSQRVATGHNADDNIETLFLNLLRGSGTAGLRGMLPDNGETLRPLLQFSRREILGLLDEGGVTYVTDSTNLHSDYRRNFLRNEVIPLLRSRWEGFDSALQRSLKCLRSENRLVEASLSEALPPSDSPLPAAVVLEFPDPELLVRRYISELGPFAETAAEVVAAMRANKPDVRRWTLKKGKLELRKNFLSKKGV